MSSIDFNPTPWSQPLCPSLNRFLLTRRTSPSTYLTNAKYPETASAERLPRAAGDPFVSVPRLKPTHQPASPLSSQRFSVLGSHTAQRGDDRRP